VTALTSKIGGVGHIEDEKEIGVIAEQADEGPWSTLFQMELPPGLVSCAGKGKNVHAIEDLFKLPDKRFLH
jgi:hypothetical protein